MRFSSCVLISNCIWISIRPHLTDYNVSEESDNNSNSHSVYRGILRVRQRTGSSSSGQVSTTQNYRTFNKSDLHLPVHLRLHNSYLLSLSNVRLASKAAGFLNQQNNEPNNHQPNNQRNHQPNNQRHRAAKLVKRQTGKNKTKQSTPTPVIGIPEMLATVVINVPSSVSYLTLQFRIRIDQNCEMLIKKAIAYKQSKQNSSSKQASADVGANNVDCYIINIYKEDDKTRAQSQKDTSVRITFTATTNDKLITRHDIVNLVSSIPASNASQILEYKMENVLLAKQIFANDCTDQSEQLKNYMTTITILGFLLGITLMSCTSYNIYEFETAKKRNKQAVLASNQIDLKLVMAKDRLLRENGDLRKQLKELKGDTCTVAISHDTLKTKPYSATEQKVNSASYNTLRPLPSGSKTPQRRHSTIGHSMGIGNSPFSK